MSRPDELIAAATAFDEALAHYARNGDLFVKTPLSSVKHLERANQALADLAAAEERLQAAGQVLAQALGAARTRQEELATAVIAHVPVVQAKNAQLSELMAALGAIAAEVATINTTVQDNPAKPAVIDAREVSEGVLALANRAAEIAVQARDAELDEVGTQAHALHQRLLAIGKKLQKATS
jgi:ABC-type transporter Mla subunit MlaD